MIVRKTSSTPGAVGPAIQVDALGKSYGDGATEKKVIADVTFEVDRGEFVCLVGPSGAGKTTLLRCLSGLTEPTAGACVVGGAPVNGPPETLAVVFQDYSRSLLPWLTVEGNLELPVKRRLAKAQRRERIARALEEVGLEGTGNLHPWQLSGGMQQRVAIARALVYHPETLLMDEPFAAVDAQTRAELEDLMLALQRAHGMTILLVTHDIDEAVYLGNRVIVLSGSPTRVQETIDVHLAEPRDQVTSKAEPEYADKRGRVFKLIKEAKAATKR